MRIRWALTLLWAVAATVGALYWQNESERSVREARHLAWAHQVSTIHGIEFATSDLRQLLSETGGPGQVVTVYARLSDVSTLLLEQETRVPLHEWGDLFGAMSQGTQTLGGLLTNRPLSEIKSELLQDHLDQFNRLIRLMDAVHEVYQAKGFDPNALEPSPELKQAAAAAREYLNNYPRG